MKYLTIAPTIILYPLIRVCAFIDYAIRRIFNGWGMIFRKCGWLVGLFLSWGVIGTFPLCLIPLWIMGWRVKTYYYIPRVNEMHQEIRQALK